MEIRSLDNAWERAKRRLALLEQQLDPMTQRRLVMLGVRSFHLEHGVGSCTTCRSQSELSIE